MANVFKKDINDALGAIKDKRIILFTMNGFQMKGAIREVIENGNDPLVRVQDNEGKENFVPYHAISTIQQ